MHAKDHTRYLSGFEAIFSSDRWFQETFPEVRDPNDPCWYQSAIGQMLRRDLRLPAWEQVNELVS